MPGALTLLRGPAGAGKSAVTRRMLAAGEVDVVADFSALHAALTGAERDGDGRLPEREWTDARIPLAMAVVTAASRQALRRGLRVVRTTSTSSQDMIDSARELAELEDAAFEVVTEDPGEAVVRDRLSGADGRLSDSCRRALQRWYG